MIRKFLLIVALIVSANLIHAQKKKADAYYSKGLYAKAIPLYIKASQKNGAEQQDALVKLGDCYRLLNEFKKAESSYKQAVSLKGNLSPDVHYNYGYVLKTNNNYKDVLNGSKVYATIHIVLCLVF